MYTFIGSLVGGWLADSVGFNAINSMGAIAVGAAVLLLLFSLWPAERKKRAEEAASGARICPPKWVGRCAPLE